jgi:transposase-like protein
VLKPKKELKIRCIYCNNPMERICGEDGRIVLECSNPKCKHHRSSCRMSRQLIDKVRNRLTRRLKAVEKDLDVVDARRTRIPKKKVCKKCGRKMVHYKSNKFCEVWVCPTFFRRKETGKWNDREVKVYWKVDKEQLNEVLSRTIEELGIGSYFLRDSAFSPNVILRALEIFFRYPSIGIEGVMTMLADEGVNVSRSTVRQWVFHGAILFDDASRKFKLPFGDEWRIDELFTDVLGIPVYVWIVIDEHRQVIAWHLSVTRDTVAATAVMRKALDHAGFCPKKIITDGLKSYHKAWKKLFWRRKRSDRKTEHIIVGSFKDDVSNNLLERFNGTLRKLLRGFRGIKAIRFLVSVLTSFSHYYNFIRPHTGKGLDGRSPAEARGIPRITGNLGKFFSV